MVNRFNVTLIESIRYNSVRFNWLTMIAKHHGQLIQHCLVRIVRRYLVWFNWLYHRKASWSIGSTSLWSNRCKSVRFNDSLSSQSIMVNRFNVTLIKSIRYNSVQFNWLTIIVKHHVQSVQRHLDRIDTIQFGSIQLTHYHRKASWSICSTSPWSNWYDAIRFDSIDLLSSQGIMVNWYDTIQIITILSKHLIQSISQPLHQLFAIILARSVLYSINAHINV